jgi:hypothetical protein
MLCKIFSAALSLVLWSGVAAAFQHQAAASQYQAPEIINCTPAVASVNSVLELEGYRLGGDDPTRVQVTLWRGSIRYPARTGGSRSVTNDRSGGSQSLEVIVPEELPSGSYRLTIEVDGHRSAPVNVEIGHWMPPSLQSLRPSTGRPGEFIWIFGTGFHVYDDIEITDARGRKHLFSRVGASAGDTTFSIPKNMPEGEATVRIGNSQYGNGQYSAHLRLTITNGPQPLELWTGEMEPVAPGQWIDLVVSSTTTLESSERTEVLFKQGDQSVIVSTSKPDNLHLRVPSTLLAGEVQLQSRTWQNGVASEWSEPRSYELSKQPVAPHVQAIEVGPDWKQVFLWPGPDKPESFVGNPGQPLIFRSSLPVATIDQLRVTLEGPGGVITIRPTEAERSGINVELPLELEPGEWRLTIGNPQDGTQAQLPIIMLIRPQ